MVIALFALSLVMIVGGVAAVVQGFPYVRLESGLAMVIGGTTAASAGVVLVGIAAAVAQLKRMEAMPGRGAVEAGHEPVFPEAAPAPPAAAFRAPAFEEAPPIPTEPRPSLAGAAGLAGVTLGAAAAAGSPNQAASAGGPDPLGGQRFELEPLLPPAGDPPLAEEDLFAAPDDAERPDAGPDPAQVELALRSSLDEPAAGTGRTEPQIEAPAAPEPAAKDEKDGLQVVGTYASGANTYVMFADGTVEAQTPRGRFTFQSLDELKQFVETGGETPARGAA